MECSDDPWKTLTLLIDFNRTEHLVSKQSSELNRVVQTMSLATFVYVSYSYK
jgi:hypothetical protein